MKRLTPALAAFLLTVAALMPSVVSLRQINDESQCAWSAAYFGGKLARFDFSSTPGVNQFTEPNWAPLAAWNLTQPVGTRFIYALAIAAFDLPVNPRALVENPAGPIPEDTLVPQP